MSPKAVLWIHRVVAIVLVIIGVVVFMQGYTWSSFRWTTPDITAEETRVLSGRAQHFFTVITYNAIEEVVDVGQMILGLVFAILALLVEWRGLMISRQRE